MNKHAERLKGIEIRLPAVQSGGYFNEDILIPV